ncbi:ANTAR domain-containing protein [Arthrobacter burdickii]|uniref:ANTAR domain-containing protein n=1 Tax=Arthrobacter burdickii TaxID=3035920 RepID=A0ABT8K251_9MICC|nr:ANTAR domain-containing protein [Arthrobacter burdickii]MDN4610682.1 ANTAR domain-containing protein [Arthrobacter burdickii]
MAEQGSGMAEQQHVAQRRPVGAADALRASTFEATTLAYSLMDTDFVILDVNTAFAEATGMARDELVGHQAFELFPENPLQSDDAPARAMRQSLERVISTRQRDSMIIHRYDIPDPDQPGAFVERYWSPVNIPVFDDDGELIAILQQVEDVTDYREDLVKVLGYLQEPTPGTSSETSRRFVEYAATAMAHSSLYHSARREVEQLQEALTSRGVIDQAKGILMGRYRCGSDEAFQRLKQMSNDSNVRLRDVATALIYQVSAPGSAPAKRGES